MRKDVPGDNRKINSKEKMENIKYKFFHKNSGKKGKNALKVAGVAALCISTLGGVYWTTSKLISNVTKDLTAATEEKDRLAKNNSELENTIENKEKTIGNLTKAKKQLVLNKSIIEAEKEVYKNRTLILEKEVKGVYNPNLQYEAAIITNGGELFFEGRSKYVENVANPTRNLKQYNTLKESLVAIRKHTGCIDENDITNCLDGEIKIRIGEDEEGRKVAYVLQNDELKTPLREELLGDDRINPIRKDIDKVAAKYAK